jgi:hypothetical protein
MEFKSFLEYDISNAIKNIAKTFRYGTYCGPNKTGDIVSKPCNVHDSGDPLKPPKDKLDSLCMSHDVDYCKCGDEWTAGLLGNKGSECSREADKKFIGDIRQNIDSMSPKEKFVANLILAYFRMHGNLQKII